MSFGPADQLSMLMSKRLYLHVDEREACAVYIPKLLAFPSYIPDVFCHGSPGMLFEIHAGDKYNPDEITAFNQSQFQSYPVHHDQPNDIEMA